MPHRYIAVPQLGVTVGVGVLARPQLWAFSGCLHHTRSSESPQSASPRSTACSRTKRQTSILWQVGQPLLYRSEHAQRRPYQ